MGAEAAEEEGAGSTPGGGEGGRGLMGGGDKWSDNSSGDV